MSAHGMFAERIALSSSHRRLPTRKRPLEDAAGRVGFMILRPHGRINCSRAEPGVRYALRPRRHAPTGTESALVWDHRCARVTGKCCRTTSHPVHSRTRRDYDGIRWCIFGFDIPGHCCDAAREPCCSSAWSGGSAERT